MHRVASSILVVAVLFPQSPAFAQNPCAEQGPGCRVMTAAETKALKDRFLALKAALPVPDPARYTPDGAGDASEMPFVAETSVAPGPLTCLYWPAGCFTEQDSVLFGYAPKAAAGESKPPAGILGRAQALMAGLENRVEVSAVLRPHPHLVGNDNGKCVDVMEDTAVDVQKTVTFLAYDHGEDASNLTMIFGPRTCNEDETVRVETTAKALAQVVSIEVGITGPPEEVAALKKKVNRKALEALLGPVVK